MNYGHDEDWVHSLISLNPIVLSGRFVNNNPFVDKHAEEQQNKIFKYEKFFNEKLIVLEKMRQALNLDKQTENTLFNNLNTFKTLNEYFIRQLDLSLNFIKFQELLKHHLNNFMRIFQSYLSNYEQMMLLLYHLRHPLNKKMRKLDITEEILQYPIEYLRYYQNLSNSSSLDIQIQFEKPLPLNIEELPRQIDRFRMHLRYLKIFKHQLETNPFAKYFLKLLIYTTEFKLIDQCVVNDRIEPTPTTEKFLRNSYQSVHEFFEIKLTNLLDSIEKYWDNNCYKINEVINFLEAWDDLIGNYEISNKNKNHSKHLHKIISIEKKLIMTLPSIEKLFTKLMQVQLSNYLNYLKMIFTNFQAPGEDIIDHFYEQMEFKKINILELSYNGSKVLKYYFNSPNNDVTPSNPAQSFVINKFFDWTT